MRQNFPNEGLGRLCQLFVVSRQAYYDAEVHYNKTTIARTIVINLVKELRLNVPYIGTRKLIFQLIPHLEEHRIKMGRDQLFDILRFHGLLIRRRVRMVKTTNSHHWLKRYPNLTQGLILTGPEQLWVSDITYIRTLSGFSYLSLITDAYSRKIVGYCLYPTLEAIGCLEALEMAMRMRSNDNVGAFILIHHSDRGIQYCSTEYTKILRESNVAISMTQSGSPYENALAERVNGIIKNEFYPKRIYQKHKDAKKNIDRIVASYNSIRPHSSINYLTPNQAHLKEGYISKRWKNYSKPFIKTENEMSLVIDGKDSL